MPIDFPHTHACMHTGNLCLRVFVGVRDVQEYNEMQHLRIMESLGGDTLWSDRFLARHAAIIYFWVLALVGGWAGGWRGVGG